MEMAQGWALDSVQGWSKEPERGQGLAQALALPLVSVLAVD